MSIPFNPNHKWCRYRFYTHAEDNRPIIFNPSYPWWVSQHGEDEKGEYSVCIAYLPEGDNLYRYWDDATNVEFTIEDEIKFTDRFPKPKYYEPK